jgi:hypothetical protein
MRPFLTLSFFFISFFSYAQQPALLWAKSMDGTPAGPSFGYSYIGYSVAVDAAGNVYTTGQFRGTADFDPGPGIFNLTSGPGYSTFFSKLDATGNFVWAKQIEGYSAGYSIAVDAGGNVYTTAYFDRTIDFDPGPGIFNLTSAGLWDVYISKLDTHGNFVWAKRIGGSDTDLAFSIALDALGNVYTTGQFKFTADFDPGPGTFDLVSPGGSYDIFISKLDTAGNFVWARRMGGTSDDEGHSIAVDPGGNVYTTGRFRGTGDFDPGPGTFAMSSVSGFDTHDIFVSKLDAGGNFVWAKQLGAGQGNSIAVDALGNVYTTGFFSRGTADFDPGPDTFKLISANGNGFVSKLDASGNFVWAIGIGFQSNSIVVDPFGNVYTAGSFGDINDFDPGPGTYNLISAGGVDIFVSKFDNAGNLVWAKSIGGPSEDVGYSIAVDVLANVHVTGYFTRTADFDPGPAIFNLTALGDNNNIFVVKWTQSFITPPVGGNACPTDSTIILASCKTITTVIWPVPTDTFPSTISIPAGLTPQALTPTGLGQLNYLGSFLNHGYYRSSDAYRWPIANNTTMSIGGHLTTFNSAAENNFILDKVINAYGYFSWIGFMRSNIQSGFEWVTGDPVNYTNWGPADPNNYFGTTGSLVEPFVHIYEGSGKWHDLLDVSLPFLAEFDAPLIRWRQISGPPNGSNLSVGIYAICYERTNFITNQKDTCCFTVIITCNNTMASTRIPGVASQNEAANKARFRITASPNPSPNRFTLKVSSENKDRIRLKVTDLTGRIIEVRDNLMPNQIVQIGYGYKPGVYFVQVVQGTRAASMKLIKQSE